VIVLLLLMDGEGRGFKDMFEYVTSN
jgi:hypothetical protein